ncbi:MAG: transposase [Actinomycetia bacterium]|nr:transposase [Actinomycetes bacterium]
MKSRRRDVCADAAFEAAKQMPGRTREQKAARTAAFRELDHKHGFTNDAAMTFASSLRKSWVREHLPAQETQNLGARAFDAVRRWHLGKRGKPRFKSVSRGLHSLSAKDTCGALRPKTDPLTGALIGQQWGRGFVIPIAAPARGGRRGKEQQAELGEIEALIATGKVLSARIIRTVIAGRDTYRMQLVCDGHPTARHPVGDQKVSFDLGPSQIAVTAADPDGSWAGWIEPLAAEIGDDSARLRRRQRKLDRAHRAGSPGCFNPDGTHKKRMCDWRDRSATSKRTAAAVAEAHRQLAEHRLSLHGALANKLIGHGAEFAGEKLNYVSWQKSFPRRVRDRAPGLLVEILRRKAESAGAGKLYEYSTYTTACSQTCLCGNRKKKPLSQRVHRCECGITEDRDLFSAYLGQFVSEVEGFDRLDVQAASQGWLCRQDIDGSPTSSRKATPKRRGRRHHPHSRRSVARIKARRKRNALNRQSRSARTCLTATPTAVAA